MSHSGAGDDCINDSSGSAISRLVRQAVSQELFCFFYFRYSALSALVYLPAPSLFILQ